MDACLDYIYQLKGNQQKMMLHLHELLAADPVSGCLPRDQIEKMIADTENKMKKAPKELDFI